MSELLYRRVFEELRQAIRAGDFAVGEKLPSEAELTAKFSVSAITLKRALDLLRVDGYIIRRPRLGTFVVSAEPVTPVTAATQPLGLPLIGCVVTTFDDTFGTRIIEGLLDGASRSAHLIVKRTGGDQTREDELVRDLVEIGASGIVLLPSSSQFIPPAVLELVTRQFPVVILDRLFDGVPLSAVCSDNFGGGKTGTEYLFELGHQQVGLITSSSQVSTTADRRQGYIRAHAEFHIPLDENNELHTIESTVPGSSVSIEDDIARLGDFVSAHPKVTAYLVSEYNIAVMLREAVKHAGLSIPEDISVVCFDHPTAFADRGLFRFTHVSQDQNLLGENAIQQVLAQVANPKDTHRVVVPTQLVIGRSTRAR